MESNKVVKIITVYCAAKDNSLKEKAKSQLTRTYFELIPLTDKSIIVDEKCTGCGTCEKFVRKIRLKLLTTGQNFSISVRCVSHVMNGTHPVQYTIGAEQTERSTIIQK